MLEFVTNTAVKTRLLNNRTKLLKMLLDAEDGVTNWEFANTLGGKWSARMSELRRLGFVIYREPVSEVKGLYRYYIDGCKEPELLTPEQEAQELINNEEFQVVDADRLVELLHANGLFISRTANYERGK